MIITVITTWFSSVTIPFPILITRGNEFNSGALQKLLFMPGENTTQNMTHSMSTSSAKCACALTESPFHGGFVTLILFVK